MKSLQKLHAYYVFDVKSAVDSPGHFARNLSTYCGASGITEVGAAGVPYLKSAAAAEFAKLGKGESEGNVVSTAAATAQFP